jgi:hypothetical protein
MVSSSSRVSVGWIMTTSGDGRGSVTISWVVISGAGVAAADGGCEVVDEEVAGTDVVDKGTAWDDD